MLLIPQQTVIDPQEIIIQPTESPQVIATLCPSPTPEIKINSTPIITILPKVITAPIPSYEIKSKNKIYLTFDDGYNQEYIRSILDTLEKNNIKCTFFIIGKTLDLPGYPELWQRAIKDGDEICYHTMKHEDLTKLTNSQIQKDLDQWNIVAQKVLGPDYIIKKYVRCPGGNGTFTTRIKTLFESQGYTLFYWNDDTYSTVIKYHLNDPVSTTSSLIFKHIIANAKTNSIILFHFNKYDTPAIPEIITKLSQQYQFGTLSEYLGKT